MCVAILGRRSSAPVSSAPEQRAADERTGAARRAHTSENMYIRACTVQIEQQSIKSLLQYFQHCGSVCPLPPSRGAYDDARSLSGTRRDKRGGRPHTRYVFFSGDLTTAICTGETTNHDEGSSGPATEHHGAATIPAVPRHRPVEQLLSAGREWEEERPE